MAFLLSQCVLKECCLFPLVIDLLEVRVILAMPVLLDCQLCVNASGNELISGCRFTDQPDRGASKRAFNECLYPEVADFRTDISL